MSTETGINFIDEICANNIVKMDIMCQYLHHVNLIIQLPGDDNFGVQTGHNSIKNNIKIRYEEEAIKLIDEIFGFLSGQKLSLDDANNLSKYIFENYSQLFFDFIVGRYDELSDELKGYVKYLVKYCGDLFKHGEFEESALFRKFTSAFQTDAEEIYRMFIKIGIVNQRHWISRGVHGKEYRYNRGYVPESAWKFMESVSSEKIQKGFPRNIKDPEGEDRLLTKDRTIPENKQEQAAGTDISKLYGSSPIINYNITNIEIHNSVLHKSNLLSSDDTNVDADAGINHDSIATIKDMVNQSSNVGKKKQTDP